MFNKMELGDTFTIALSSLLLAKKGSRNLFTKHRLNKFVYVFKCVYQIT